MIDTHTHLYLPEFDADRPEVMARALDAGVTHMVFPNIDASTVAPLLRACEQWPGCTSPAMGLHPTSVGDDWERQLDVVMAELRRDPSLYVAVGEVGMDLYWDKTFRDEQREVLRRQLLCAAELSLPVIIHCREALTDTLEVIAEAGFEGPLVFHSFTGTTEDVRRIRRAVADPWFGINGVVTFKSAGPLREALEEIGVARIVTETDSPYLAPVPHRGKRNESSYLPAVIAQIALTLDFDEGFTEYFTTNNAIKIFQSL
ncbi:MAG: TatD family hydrolase [Candidatus Amulumruptor caecigallinarius]|nr:TatD family hydrolase [Candidatus Amulumruptor caecigallinarius]MCM1397367.1 TatD family hydrolase [Candidatus Amulumruptor caecigallinarius]MCM1454735.1 TatD family hydrolase [bacterium]